jgi:hypothetical protein
MHKGFSDWKNRRMTLLEEAHQKVREMLESHQPLPLKPEVVKELEKIALKAKDAAPVYPA